MYLLKCSVCDGEFNSKEKWTCHLTEERHLFKARKKCVRWSQKKRRHALVIYSTFSLSSSLGLTLLQKLSKDLLTFVTDFVWREGNSRVGVIQFESSDRIDKVSATLGNPKSLRTEVGGYPVMFRRAIDLEDLEWDTIVTPELEESEEFSEQEITMAREQMLDKVDEVKKKGQRISSEQGESQQQHLETETVVSSSTTPAVQKERQKESNNSLNSCKITGISLHEQFSALLETVRIPDSEFNAILGIIKDLDAAFLGFSKNLNTTVRVVMLNNWHLQLRNSTYNYLQLFVYKEDDSPTDLIKWEPINSDEVFEQLQKVDCFGRPRKKSYTDPKSDPMPGMTFIHKESGIKFVIAKHPLLMAEAQRCRLLKYYLTFDTRIKSLIALVYLWARINSVRISRRNDDDDVWEVLSKIQDPGPLEWLLVVFLIREKIIPSVREVQQNRHNHLCLGTKKFDMGFYEDKEYAERWSGKVKTAAEGTDEFALSVLELAGKFFLFCASLKSKDCVINTKDGEVLPRSFFHVGEAKTQGNRSVPIVSSKLSLAAVQRLRQDLNGPKYNEIKKRMNMIHPFNIRWRFSIDIGHFRCTVCPMMETTGENLNQFLRQTKFNSNDKQVFRQGNFDLEGLLNCNL